MLVEAEGKEMRAIDVFTAAIKYMKKYLLEVMEKRGSTELTENKIAWIITVPAIWDNGAKQFMRQAAQYVSR